MLNAQIKDVISKFPTREHPQYNSDDTVEHMAHFREHFPNIIDAPFMFELEERILEIDLLELRRFMELGFHFSKDERCFISEWVSIPNSHPKFALIFNDSWEEHQNYGYYGLFWATPNADFSSAVLLIAKEEPFHSGDPVITENAKLFFAVLTHEEIVELLNILSENDKREESKEKVQSLIDQSCPAIL